MLAIIGGTGFRELAGLTDVQDLQVDTDYGTATLQRGNLDGVAVLFLSRHGTPATYPPHKINYRANIQALKDSGATAIFGVTAVGSVDASLAVPELVVPNQVIDYTWGRAHTFFDEKIHHIDLTWPYDPALRELVLAAAADVRETAPGLLVRESGVYGCTQGPRLETAAEIVRLQRDGCHIVGMTGMPEIALARERELPYVGVSVVVNAGAGLDGQAVDLAGIEAAMSLGMDWVLTIARLVVVRYSAGS